VEQVPALLGTADARVVLPPSHEAEQVHADVVVERRLMRACRTWTGARIGAMTTESRGHPV
jgi:hypothetical protein